MRENRSVSSPARIFSSWPAVGFFPLLIQLALGLMALSFAPPAKAVVPVDISIQTPQSGDHALHILSSNLLELVLINTESPNSSVSPWNWVNNQQLFVAPRAGGVEVIVDGQLDPIIGMGFKRRPVYAPLLNWDLRIGNQLYLQLSNSIPNAASVKVLNNGSVWPSTLVFSSSADPLRFNPAIHVNQEGYMPGYPKVAVVGYYLGDMGEMQIPSTKFELIEAASGNKVFEGSLNPRKDVGYLYLPAPYQAVFQADFTAFNTPGEYRVSVPGMGASLPFHIDEGIAMDFARTYELGIFHQRGGYDVNMPFTRFTHAADHLAPALVPTNASALFAFTWRTVSNYCTQINPDNPPQVAPAMTNYSAQLFPFVNQVAVSVSGGHFEAGDYNRVTYNAAQVAHVLLFAADSLPGVGQLDNMGIPESGDGISDLLQEAKWEADFIAKMQDADGAFYYSVYPRDREYEMDVLPENGDPQVVWPKNTASTAAAVAALAQCASSPQFKRAYPQTATNYLAKALLGWQFLTNAIATFGLEGSYQKIQHFDEDFTHHDELAWAACELYLATGDRQFQDQLFQWFPDPTDQATFRWGWQRMGVCYGNTIRDYAFAVSSGRLSANQVSPDYVARCVSVITNCGNDVLGWSQDNAYGTSFPDLTKAYQGGGWYFSPEQAFDMVVAYQFNPDPNYIDAILRNVNYEGGCNPVNVSYITGLGWKRPRNVVDQYSLNDRRALPKDGVPISNIQAGFERVWTYDWTLSSLVYPSDYTNTAPYSYYDRWCDDWNVSTEGSTTDTARSLAATAWLAAQTAPARQPWRFTNASIVLQSASSQPGQPVTAMLNVADPNLDSTHIIWEASGQEPAFGGMSYSFNPGTQTGPAWIEAEVQWPDGRRAFATNSVMVTTVAPPVMVNVRPLANGGVGFSIAGTPFAKYVIQVSTDLQSWSPISTNTVSSSGLVGFSDPQAGVASPRFYRAVRSQ